MNEKLVKCPINMRDGILAKWGATRVAFFVSKGIKTKFILLRMRGFTPRGATQFSLNF